MPSGVWKVAVVSDMAISFHLVLSTTPKSTSCFIHFRNNGDAFIDFGKTRPVEPVKVSIPKEFTHLITSFGPNSSNALPINFLSWLIQFLNLKASSFIVKFRPDFPAIRNFLPKVGMESITVIFKPLRMAISAAISPAGPPPITSIFLLFIA